MLPVDDKLIVSCTIPAPSVRLNIPLTDNVPSPVIPVLEFICELYSKINVPSLTIPFSADDAISTKAVRVAVPPSSTVNTDPSFVFVPLILIFE